jgi:hypothetical protein
LQAITVSKYNTIMQIMADLQIMRSKTIAKQTVNQSATVESMHIFRMELQNDNSRHHGSSEDDALARESTMAGCSASQSLAICNPHGSSCTQYNAGLT